MTKTILTIAALVATMGGTLITAHAYELKVEYSSGITRTDDELRELIDAGIDDAISYCLVNYKADRDCEGLVGNAMSKCQRKNAKRLKKRTKKCPKKLTVKKIICVDGSLFNGANGERSGSKIEMNCMDSFSDATIQNLSRHEACHGVSRTSDHCKRTSQGLRVIELCGKRPTERSCSRAN